VLDLVLGQDLSARGAEHAFGAERAYVDAEEQRAGHVDLLLG
jgi:hypothetical protein